MDVYISKVMTNSKTEPTKYMYFPSQHAQKYRYCWMPDKDILPKFWTWTVTISKTKCESFYAKHSQ